MISKRRVRELLPRWVIGGVLLILSILAFNPSAKASATGKIVGTVIDIETGEPLPGANIVIQRTTKGAAADPDGYFIILNVSPDIYNIQARMMGYESVTQTGVEVTTDHTTRIRFELKSTVVRGEGVTVRAEAELIKMDVSSSIISAKTEEIEAVPLVTNIGDYVNLQSGVENWEIRGGGTDQTAFMANGLMLVDNRSNSMLMEPNISTVKELNIIKGGFNAEYGNVRSGIINIVTKDPSSKEYHGTVNFRYVPAQKKHRGPSVFEHNNYLLRPYLDTTTLPNGESVAFYGTSTWEDTLVYGPEAGEDTLNKYKAVWQGWNSWAENHGMTPEQAMEQFIWVHCAEGVLDLVPDDYEGHSRDRTYWKEPDWNVDGSFGGPVPIIGQYLGDLAFLASYRTDYQQFGLPVTQGYDFYHDWNASFKLTSHITDNIKLSAEAIKEVIYTLGAYATGEKSGGTVGVRGTGSYGRGDPGGFMLSGDDVFHSGSCEYVDGEWGLNTLYYPSAFSPAIIDKNMQGISISHALSSSTFYTLRFTHIDSENKCNNGFGVDTGQTTFQQFINPGVDPLPERNTITTYTLPSGVEVTETPYGYVLGESVLGADNTYTGGNGSCQIDLSSVETYNLQFDITSQINRFNEIKSGFIFNYDDMYTHAEKNFPGGAEGWIIEWNHQPIRGGAYLQDKLEFEGFIANIGLRMDYNNPNCEWLTLEEPYAQVLTSGLKDTLRSDNPPSEIMSPAEYQMQWSPRIGISHPISENAKLYFNYGHFYSMAPSNEMYLMHFGKAGDGMAALGNPSASMPKTIAYELGADFNIGEMFRLHLAGYYKDVDRQTAWVRYQAEDAAVLDYSTVENNNYEDIRGFELRFEKSYGRFVKGWINYDYMVTTSGTVGREFYYEESIKNQTQGMLDPIQETPLPRPRMNAFIQFSSPHEWGPIFRGFNLSFLYEWHAGWWETWNPLESDEPRFQNNLQWQPWRNINARLSRTISYSGIDMNVFMEVKNLLDWKYLDPNGFGPGVTEGDKDEYLKSLKLEIYNDPVFEGMEDYEPGNDKVGDLNSFDKPYINDPNIAFLAFHNPRTLVFGVKLDF